MWNWFLRSYYITSPFQVSCHITGNDVALVRETAVRNYRWARISFHFKCILYRFSPRCPQMTRLPSGWIKTMTVLITGKKCQTVPISHSDTFLYCVKRKTNRWFDDYFLPRNEEKKFLENVRGYFTNFTQAWSRIIYCGCCRVQEWRGKEWRRGPVPVAARSKTCVCGRSLAWIVGSNSAGDMDVCQFWALCVVR